MATASVGLGAPALVGVAPVVRRERRAWHLLVRNRMAIAGAAIIVVWVLLAVVAPVVAPYDPIDQQVRLRLQGPSATHLLGVD